MPAPIIYSAIIYFLTSYVLSPAKTCEFLPLTIEKNQAILYSYLITNMKYLPLKIWFIVAVTLALLSVVIRAVWQIIVIPTAGTLTIFIPLIFTILGINALITYFTIKPDLKKLKSPPALLGIMLVLTGGLISGVAHYNNFIFSPEAEPLTSKIIATLLILGTVSAYFLAIWVIWSIWKSRKN